MSRYMVFIDESGAGADKQGKDNYWASFGIWQIWRRGWRKGAGVRSIYSRDLL